MAFQQPLLYNDSQGLVGELPALNKTTTTTHRVSIPFGEAMSNER